MTRDPCSVAHRKKERGARVSMTASSHGRGHRLKSVPLSCSYNRNWNDTHEGFLVASGSGMELMTATGGFLARGGRVASVGRTNLIGAGGGAVGSVTPAARSASMAGRV